MDVHWLFFVVAMFLIGIHRLLWFLC